MLPNTDRHVLLDHAQIYRTWRDDGRCRWDLTGESIEIGRSRYSNIQLAEDEMVSRRHARVERHGDDWYIRDLGSMNGTEVDEVVIPAHEPMRLEDGAWIKVGYTFLRFIARRTESLTRDRLTRTWNKTVFLLEVERALATASASTAIVLFNVDRMRTINDTWGNLIGDSLLTQLAGRIQDDTPDIAMLARVAGDWFGALLPDCSPDMACRWSERVRRHVDERAFGCRGEVVDATISGSVAMLAEADTPAALFDILDDRMWTAQRRGRNTIVGSWNA